MFMFLSCCSCHVVCSLFLLSVVGCSKSDCCCLASMFVTISLDSSYVKNQCVLGPSRVWYPFGALLFLCCSYCVLVSRFFGVLLCLDFYMLSFVVHVLLFISSCCVIVVNVLFIVSCCHCVPKKKCWLFWLCYLYFLSNGCVNCWRLVVRVVVVVVLRSRCSMEIVVVLTT